MRVPTLFDTGQIIHADIRECGELRSPQSRCSATTSMWQPHLNRRQCLPLTAYKRSKFALGHGDIVPRKLPLSWPY